MTVGLPNCVMADKRTPTNSPPPLLQMTLPQSGGNALAGDPALSGIRFREQMWTGLVSNGFARIEKWFRRGAWNDGQVMYFDDDWRFPYGGEHLSSVEIWAQGQIYPSEKSPDPIVSLVTPLALKPGETEVFCGRTADNGYRVEWRNAHPNRDAGRLADASIELRRNGDCIVTENGVTHVVPYDVPFPHDGFGQDADWVRANFTNADEILFTGYGNWVDGLVGIGETNGLYKFTAYFAEDPPEATELYVGDYTVAVTNAGEVVVEAAFGRDSAIQPRFVLPITTLRHIPVRAFVCRTGNQIAAAEASIISKIDYANRIFSQIGIYFDLLSISNNVGSSSDWAVSEYDMVTNIFGVTEQIWIENADIPVNGEVMSKPRDWGEEQGRGFYEKTDSGKSILYRLLMYGIDGKNSLDVPSHDVLSLIQGAFAPTLTFHSNVGVDFIIPDNSEVFTQ